MNIFLLVHLNSAARRCARIFRHIKLDGPSACVWVCLRLSAGGKFGLCSLTCTGYGSVYSAGVHADVSPLK